VLCPRVFPIARKKRPTADRSDAINLPQKRAFPNTFEELKTDS